MPAEAPRSDVFHGVALRPPSTVMRLARLGSFFPTRLSFMPALLRRLARERWRLEVPRWALDAGGYGHAVLTLRSGVGDAVYSLVAFSHELDPALRSDRVIAEAWDATFVLYDGVPDDAEIARLGANAPLQEAGRFCPRDLVLSRANRSSRVFEQVVESLSRGRQPDRAALTAIGYLMRTTAVYGNGKFGIADRVRLVERPELAGPFQAEMMTVYLIRSFVFRLVEHLAESRARERGDPGEGRRAAPLDRELKRCLGIGNATGLGMAPFLVNHPILLNNWILARETALARVRAQPVSPPSRERLGALLARARRHCAEWQVDDRRQMARIEGLREDLERLERRLAAPRSAAGARWDALYRWAERSLGLEAQELLVSLLLETHPEEVDALCETMGAAERTKLDPAMTLGRLAELIAEHYDWALAIDLEEPDRQRLFWYVSEEKHEPRLGDRYREAGAEREMPFAVARDVQDLAGKLAARPRHETVAAFLADEPGLRHVVRRIQTVALFPYAEIRDSLVDAACLPIDLLRCKLSFFGAAKYDPKSDRWTRVTMFQGAPLPEELDEAAAADWCFPAFGAGQALPARQTAPA